MNRFRTISMFTSLLLLAAWTPTAWGQPPSQPSSIFGALPFPEFDVINEFGVMVNRFTNDGKPSDLVSPKVPQACKEVGKGVGRTCDYRLDRVIGFNSVYGSFSRRFVNLPFASNVPAILRVTPQLGYTGNQPSEFFQNKFLHNRSGLDDVRWADSMVYSSAIMSLDADINLWCCVIGSSRPGRKFNKLGNRAFVGAGGSMGTIVNEAYLQAGVRRLELTHNDKAVIQISGMVRGTVFTRPGFVLMERPGTGDPDRRARGVFPRGSMGRTHTLISASIGIPVDQWIPFNGILPAIEFGISRSNFFALQDRSPERQVAYQTGRIDTANELFRTVALTWLNGDFGLETWNDSMGNKDQGPSYGARLFIRWRPEYP